MLNQFEFRVFAPPPDAAVGGAAEAGVGVAASN